MDQVYGWCSHGKASVLIDIINKTNPTTIVEIGVWGGKSLIPMACTLKALGKGKIYGIDPWSNLASVEGVTDLSNLSYWSRVDHDGVFQNLVHTLSQFGLENQVELIRKTSAEATIIPDIDILHIDGNHSDVTSYLDVTKWAPHVKSGGWIIVDDISWYEEGRYTQQRSIDWLNEHCDKMAEIPDVCIWGIWVKK
jgi:predicted O-methyltransferase YrrM